MFLVVLLMIALLTERGAISISTTLASTTNRQQYETKLQARTYAEAGFAEAKARLRGSSAINPSFVTDPSSYVDPLWSAYLLSFSGWTSAQDPEYNKTYRNYFPITGVSQSNRKVTVNSMQTTIPYWAKIRYKTEYDAEQEGHTATTPHYIDNDGNTATHTAASPGNIIYYGYTSTTAATPSYFTTADPTTFPPVTFLRTYGQSGASTATIKGEFVPQVGPNLQAASYAKGNVTLTSTSIMDGRDNCGNQPDMPSLFLKAPATVTGTPTYYPASPQSGTTDLDLLALINGLKGGATVVTADQTTFTYGDSSTYVTVYSNTSSPLNLNGLKLSTGTGFGLLLVEGDLEIGPGFKWNGLVIVTGQVTFRATAASRIYGAFLANQTSGNQVVDINGRMTIKYDSCKIAKALLPKPLDLKQWKLQS